MSGRCEGCGALLSGEEAEGAPCPVCAFGGAVDAPATPLADLSADDWMAALEPEPAVDDDATRRFAHYELLEEIGRGGMGVVYRARQKAPSRIVALKVMLPQKATDQELMIRFRAEAEAISSLDHPHILPIFEAGERDGLPYFSMKFADGGSLAGHVADYAGRPREIARLMAALAHAVDHAHRRGILHRDLKPANILLDAQGTPYVADFGIAKWLGRDGVLSTMSSSALGTPTYMAPEQASGRSADLTVAADIYSLGAIMYELLTRRPPFMADTAVEVLRQAADSPPSSPRSVDPNVPRDLENICLKCLAKEPHQRYPTADELAVDLERWLAGMPVLARPVSLAGQAWRWARRKPALAGALAAVSVLLVLLAVGSMLAAFSIQRARRAAEGERDRALRAEAESREKLFEAQLARAQVQLRDTRAGRREAALSAIAVAAGIHQTPELRDLAISALAEPELRLARTWNPRPENPARTIVFEPALEFYGIESLRGGALEIRRLADDSVVRTLPLGDLRFASPPVLSRDARFLAARVGDLSIRVWNTLTGAQILELPDRAGAEAQVAARQDYVFTPDDELILAATPDGGVTWHRLSDGAQVGAWATRTRVANVAIDPTGRTFAASHVREDKLSLIDLETGQVQRELSLPARSSSVRWSHDGRRLVLGTITGMVQVYETIESRRLVSASVGSAIVFNVLFSADDRWIFGNGGFGGVNAWEASRGGLVATLPFTSTEPNLVLDPTGRRLAGTTVNGGIWTADWIPSSVVNVEPGRFSGRERAGVFASLDFSPAARLVVTVGFPTIRVHDGVTGRVLRELPGPAGEETSAAFEADDALLVSGRTRGLRRVPLDPQTAATRGAAEEIALDAEPEFLLVHYLRWRRLAVLTNWRTSTIKVLALEGERAREVFRVTGPPRVWSAALSPDGRRLVAQATAHGEQMDGSCPVWDIETGREIARPMLGHTGTVTWTGERDPRIVSSGTNGSGVLDLRSGQRMDFPQALLAREASFFAASADGTMLVAGVREGLILERLPSLEVLATLPGVGGDAWVGPVAISADGLRVARMIGDGTLQIWNLSRLRTELKKLGLEWDESREGR